MRRKPGERKEENKNTNGIQEIKKDMIIRKLEGSYLMGNVSND